MQTRDVSAVVCTRNSIAGIERCLASLRKAKVGELIVVDAQSMDGTREVAEQLADQLLVDPGTGLGQARNIGIAETSGSLILNMGSDNVMPEGQLQQMICELEQGELHGISAQTLIEGSNYVSHGLNAWRQGRFTPGPTSVIGTPTLLLGEVLRNNPYDPDRIFSDDSELCERWSREFGAKFAISSAHVVEIGKATWPEILVRCRMYGTSDAEVYRHGDRSGWTLRRKVASLLHPLVSDFATPLSRHDWKSGAAVVPFLGIFTCMRYRYWFSAAMKNRSQIEHIKH